MLQSNEKKKEICYNKRIPVHWQHAKLKMCLRPYTTNTLNICVDSWKQISFGQKVEGYWTFAPVLDCALSISDELCAPLFHLFTLCGKLLCHSEKTKSCQMLLNTWKCNFTRFKLLVIQNVLGHKPQTRAACPIGKGNKGGGGGAPPVQGLESISMGDPKGDIL